MIFSSLEFLCVFLPVVFILYCIMPNVKVKNALLILASLFFYAYGEPIFVLLMLGSALANYLFARLIDKAEKKEGLLALAVVVNIGVLVFFKYTNFFVDSINKISGADITIRRIALPIGISFFTFQALSYVIDVYRGVVGVQKSFFKVLLYISFFPQLIAGPIVKYKDIEEALNDRKMDVDEISAGLRRFICGLGKKVLIANTMGFAADTLFNADFAQINVLGAWTAAIAYMLQIYYDFSGYSDMAIGLGKMFGFKFQENFNYPYGSTSIKEFWRRWHISLSSWFKDYLYIPLGGNRKGKARTGLNKFIVFFCTGFWHGANWTFIVWGLYHGLLSVLEEVTGFTKKIPKFIGYIYTTLAVCLGFVIFRADTLTAGVKMIGAMFGVTSANETAASFALGQLTPWFVFMLIMAIIGMAPIKLVTEKLSEKKTQAVNVILSILSIACLAWCIVRLSGSTYNPFIYFRF